MRGEIEPSPLQRPLLHALLGVVADAVWKDRAQTLLLLPRERHTVVAELDGLQAALQYVAIKRRARRDADRPVNREERITDARAVERERLLVHRAVALPARVLQRRRLVPDHLLG